MHPTYNGRPIGKKIEQAHEKNTQSIIRTRKLK